MGKWKWGLSITPHFHPIPLPRIFWKFFLENGLYFVFMPLSGKKRRSTSSIGPSGRSIKSFFTPIMPRRYSRKVLARARRMRGKYGRQGGMMVTRNAPPTYFGQSSSLGTPAIVGNTNNFNLGTVAASGGLIAGLYDVPVSCFFTLGDIINSGDFTQLFDQYRIRKVQLIFRISSGASTGAPGVGAASTAISPITNPTLYWHIDHDDANPVAPVDIRERMGVRSRQLIPGRAITITLNRPRVDVATFNSAGTVVSNGVGSGYGWFDTATTNVPNFGIKFMIQNMDLRPSASVPLWQITVERKYTVELKQVR